MLELNLEVVNTIIADATLISLMSIDANNKRVYYWEPTRDILFTPTYQAALIYRDSFGGRAGEWSYPYEWPFITYFFRVLSTSQVLLAQVSKALIDLFDLQTLQTTNWSVKWIEVVGKNTGGNEGDPAKPIYVDNVTFGFNFVFKRGS